MWFQGAMPHTPYPGCGSLIEGERLKKKTERKAKTEEETFYILIQLKVQFS